jgi:hypothetical protein
MTSLPDEVQQEFRGLLLKLKEKEFWWNPVLIGTGPVESNPTRYTERLRQIHALVGGKHAGT